MKRFVCLLLSLVLLLSAVSVASAAGKKNSDDDTAKGIARQLDIMFAEIQEFEKEVLIRWDKHAE